MDAMSKTSKGDGPISDCEVWSLSSYARGKTECNATSDFELSEGGDFFY